MEGPLPLGTEWKLGLLSTMPDSTLDTLVDELLLVFGVGSCATGGGDCIDGVAAAST